jgi:starvation-inducible outer membrane lipoprotein
MLRPVKKLLVLLLLAFGMSACDEPPQRLESAVEPGYRTDDWADQSRSRTLRQSESTRIYH